MTGGQEKNFSTLGPKLRDNRAQQYYGDKTLQIRVEMSDYCRDGDSHGTTQGCHVPLSNKM